ncbi:hypothetical protein [Nonomuraea ferruginea]|uniref:Nucleotidyltransferase AbiEii toxin of type IV toxin-antitoxin system n=1 Tax=Nonomuraea ferruginea TaxID=46174 RepID=A0ABT4SY17_9ACTN|nr:hypothetical protein [Nonomuraea ferruginea]MDA0642136.1 hypothetical protein [Nonomuraea ferruginea]
MLAVFGDPIRHGAADTVLPYSIEQLLEAMAADRPPPGPIRPRKAYDLFADRLEAMGPMSGFGPLRRAFPAVHFPSLTAEPSMELVPGCEADFLWDSPVTAPSSGLAEVAFPATEERWLGTSPALHERTLDASPGGVDYTCREAIRIIKLIKYRRSIPVLSYFLELFALRWLEGSHAFDAESISQIVEQADLGWHTRLPVGHLIDDIPALLSALAGQLGRAAAQGRQLRMIDLTTPEREGTVEACDATHAVGAAESFEAAATLAHRARAAADRGDQSAALSAWRELLRQGGVSASGDEPGRSG